MPIPSQLMSKLQCRNPEGIATVCAWRAPPFQGCAFPPNDIRDPRVAKAQPWAEIGEHLRCKPAGEWRTMPRLQAHRETEKEFKLNQYEINTKAQGPRPKTQGPRPKAQDPRPYF